MVYIFREMETFKDSEAIASQVFRHENNDPNEALKAAESQLHLTMASAIANENVRMVVCEIINERGDMEKYDAWYDSYQAPSPDPTLVEES